MLELYRKTAMDQDLVFQWLRKWAHTRALTNLLGGLGVVLAGSALVGATWGFTYLVSLFALGPWLGYHHWLLWAAGLILIPLLFWGNNQTSREYLSEYSVTVGTASEKIVSFYLAGVGTVSNINPLAPNTMHTGVKMIADIPYVTPRVVMSGLHLFGKSHRLQQLDLPGCAAVLYVLYTARRKVSFQEIANAVEGLDPTRVFPQMRDIDGVLLLSADPAGLTLSPELRQTIGAAAASRR